jgi:Clostripain family
MSELFRKLVRRKIAFLVAIAIAIGLLDIGCRKQRADWTVMVFMNAMNDLDCFALTNFAQMAEFGSGPGFNLVVELGRIEGGCRAPAWSGVRRFYVEPGATAARGSRVTGKDADMQDPQSIRSFVEWAMAKYPASRYGFVYLGHGQGYSRPLRATAQAVRLHRQQPGGFDSITATDASRDVLYNRDLADALQVALHGRLLDFLGFDVCYMGGLENAYAFRDIARYMVASETMIPFDGWNYSVWQSYLRDAGLKVDGVEMSRILVDAYWYTHYGHDNVSDVAGLDLSKAKPIADLVSQLAQVLRDRLSDPGTVRAIHNSRMSVGPGYGPLNPGDVIDLRRFVEFLAGYSKDRAVQSAANALDAAFNDFVIATKDLQSSDSGASIFFPDSDDAWSDDPDGAAYKRATGCKAHAIKFVCDADQHWTDFLADYVAKIKADSLVQH